MIKPLLFFCLIFIFSPRTECYNLLYTNGLKAYNERHFQTALQKFKAARGCPDKPDASDLEDWIRKAENKHEEQQLWRSTRRTDTRAAYERYLARYPEGYYHRRAADALQQWAKMAEKPVVETTPKGRINWSMDVVEAEGYCVINRNTYTTEAQAIAMATAGAEVVAKANLLETVQGVQIERTTTIKDMMTLSDVVYRRLDGVVKGTRIVGEPRIANGMVYVTVQMPVLGSATAVFPEKKSTTPSPDSTDNTAPHIIFKLQSPSAQRVLFPTIVDVNGGVLLDGVTFQAQNSGLPMLRYLPKQVVDTASIYPIQEDNQGRWVLPDEGLETFRKWLMIRNLGGDAGPIGVVINE